MGSTQTIRWDSNNFSGGVVWIMLKDYSKSSMDVTNFKQYIIAKYISNSGSYIWTVPSSIGNVDIGTGNNYKISIGGYITNNGQIDYNNLVSSDESNAPFSIQ